MTPSVLKWRGQGPTARDGIVTALALAATVAILAAHPDATRRLDPLGVALAVIECLPLLARRRAPLAAFAISTAASATANGLGYGVGAPIAPTIALFYIALDEGSHERIRQTAAVVLGMFAIHIGATAAGRQGFPTTAVLAGIVVWGGAWIIGDQVRQRRQRLADLVQRAERAERETQREARLAAAEERTRIARDLHDSAAHAINVILVQAGGARLLQNRDPEAVRAALGTIEDVARETIGDIDRLIRGLRDDGVTPDTVELPTGLAALDTLAERHRAAGLQVAITVEGRPRQLAPGIDQAAYRILQESLTNAARYGTGDAELRLIYTDDGLELIVSNSVAHSANGRSGNGGHGIVGMRERVELLGGTLDVERGGGRHRVRARIGYSSTPGLK